MVYKIQCKDCESSYIGKTNRVCEKIIFEEHKDPKKPSAIMEHVLTTKHSIDYDGFKIVDRASTNEKLEYKEMLYIRKIKPSDKKQKDSQLFTLVIRNQKLDKDITRDVKVFFISKKAKIRQNMTGLKRRISFEK